MPQTFINTLALLARVLIALIFVTSGLSKITGFEGTVGYIATKGLPLPAVLAACAAALELVGGLFIIVGYKTKITGAVLALFTLIAGVLFHNYWAVPAEQAFIQQIMFMKNLSIAGGLLLLTTAGVGTWAVDQKFSHQKGK